MKRFGMSYREMLGLEKDGEDSVKGILDSVRTRPWKDKEPEEKDVGPESVQEAVKPSYTAHGGGYGSGFRHGM